jgi:hypothetical protein
MLFGAAVGSITKNTILAIILAFLSHYFLDVFPHIEYSIKGAGEKLWRKKLPAIIRILIDLSLGFLLVWIFSKDQPANYIYAFVAIIPDGLTVLGKLIPNKILTAHSYIHTEKVHFLKNKKISKFWRIFSQIVALTISIILLGL